MSGMYSQSLTSNTAKILKIQKRSFKNIEIYSKKITYILTFWTHVVIGAWLEREGPNRKSSKIQWNLEGASKFQLQSEAQVHFYTTLNCDWFVQCGGWNPSQQQASSPKSSGVAVCEWFQLHFWSAIWLDSPSVLKKSTLKAMNISHLRL